VSRAQPVLLVVDDEPGMLALIERVVAPTGFRTILHGSAREALERLHGEAADVALVDLQMPEIGGLDVLRAIRQTRPQCAVILMTGHASVESAIEAVKLGALDYLTKPLDLARLRKLLGDAREEAERRATVLAADTELARRLELCGMIGRSAVMQQLFGLVRRIAPHARAALVTGETGAGTEGIARAVHELGPSARTRYVKIN
jgi:DNA-binding NtrC family response regulator